MTVQCSREDVQIIRSFCPPQRFEKRVPVIHAGHIPCCAFLIIQGGAFVKNRRGPQNFGAGELLGLHALDGNTPIAFQVDILARSEVCIIDRSTLKQLKVQLGHLFSPLD